ARRGRVKHFWLKRWLVRRRFHSSQFQDPNLWKCLSVSAHRGCAIFLNAPKKKRHVLFLLMRSMLLGAHGGKELSLMAQMTKGKVHLISCSQKWMASVPTMA